MIGGACHLIIHTSNISEFIDYTDLFTHARTHTAHMERVREREREIDISEGSPEHYDIFVCS